MYNWMIEAYLILFNFVVSGNFPATAWRAFKVVTQLMQILVIFWVLVRNRLTASSCRQATQVVPPSFLGF